jgi:hypothetical protein
VSRQRLVAESIMASDPEQTAAVLSRFVADGGRIAVRATCRLPALVAQVEALRDVIVELAPGGAGTFSVCWAGADGGDFPRFEGSLQVRGQGEGTRLRLEGAYDDRLAAAGARGESRLAYRLAQATCRETLNRLRARLVGGAAP